MPIRLVDQNEFSSHHLSGFIRMINRFSSLFSPLISLVSGLSLFTLLLTACQPESAFDNNGSALIGTPLDFVVHSEGNIDNEEWKREVIRDQARFKTVFEADVKNAEIITPILDFEKTIAVAVHSGRRNTGGYRIYIEEVAEHSDKVVVRVVDEWPGRGCFTTQVITYPYVLASFANTNKTIKFESRTVNKDCEF